MKVILKLVFALLIVASGAVLGYVFSKYQQAVGSTPKILEQNRPSIDDVKRLKPNKVEIIKRLEDIEVTFSTQEPAKSYLVLNPVSLPFDQVIDHKETVIVKVSSSPSFKHSIKLNKKLLSQTFKDKVYMYVLISYKGWIIPYGIKVDINKGPQSPFMIKL